MKKFTVFLILGLCACILGVAMYMLSTKVLSYGFVGVGILFTFAAVYFKLQEDKTQNGKGDVS